MYTVHISQCLYKNKRDCLVSGKPSSCYYSTSNSDTHPNYKKGFFFGGGDFIEEL